MRNISLALLAAAATASEHTLNAWTNTQSVGDATRHPATFELSADVNIGYEAPFEFADNDVDLQWTNSIYTNSVVSAVFTFDFLNEALSNTYFGIGVEVDFTIFEIYWFSNVLTYFQKTRSFCDKLSWYYDVLQLSTAVSLTFDECIFGVYDYFNDDITKTCAGTTYTLSDVYDKSFYEFPDREQEGWYGINTCDKEEPATEPEVDPVVPEETTDTTTETTTEETTA
jgi:hypothetical protein